MGDRMVWLATLADGLRRLRSLVGVPGLLLAFMSIVVFGYGLLMFGRESSRLRRVGGESFRITIGRVVSSTEVDEAGQVLRSYVDAWSKLSPGETRSDFESRLDDALDRLGSEFEVAGDARLSSCRVESLKLLDGAGRSLGEWVTKSTNLPESPELTTTLSMGEPTGVSLVVRYRVTEELERAATLLERRQRVLLTALLVVPGYSLLCLGFVVWYVQGQRLRVAREAAQEATLTLADRTCHELGNIVFVLGNERKNLADHLDLMERFVSEESEVLAKAGRRVGLEPEVIVRLAKAIRREYAERGIDPAQDLRSDLAMARQVCRQLSTCSDYVALTVRELDGYLKQSTLPLSVGPQDVDACVEDALTLLGPRLESAGATIHRTHEGEPPFIARADRRLLVHVLVNLLKNSVEAAQAAELSSVIDIRLKNEGRRVTIQVADQGPGLEPGIAQRVFEAGVTTKGSGRGNGLSIVRQSIERLGGRVCVDSEPGRGATFTISLPVPGAVLSGLGERFRG